MTRPLDPVPDHSLRGFALGLALMLGLGLFLGCLIMVDKVTRDYLVSQRQYQIQFHDIDSPAPPGQERADFLAEVQYLAGLPDAVPFLDDGMGQRLAAAFARHPWVETVERVAIEPRGQLHVHPRFRAPVLQVRRAHGGNSRFVQSLAATQNIIVPVSYQSMGGQAYLVDRRGRVLPSQGPGEGLPIFSSSSIPPPAGPWGTPWGDPRVEAAAAIAGFLHPYQNRLHLSNLEETEAGLLLTNAKGARILWGHPPGTEKAGEASAAEKVQRLLEVCSCVSKGPITLNLRTEPRCWKSPGPPCAH